MLRRATRTGCYVHRRLADARQSSASFICDTWSADREVRKPAAYDRAMGLFRTAMGLFRGSAGKNREKAAAGLLTEQAKTVKAQPEAARREVRREARPDPNKPGWGLTIGEEINKARGDRASQE